MAKLRISSAAQADLRLAEASPPRTPTPGVASALGRGSALAGPGDYFEEVPSSMFSMSNVAPLARPAQQPGGK